MESTERLPTPLERCAPLLLMLASFRASPPPDPEGVSAFRDRLLARLDGILKDAAADSRAHEPMHRLRSVLIYGIDGVVVATLGDRSPEWSRLEFDLIGTTEGGDRFFDLLENSTEHRDPAIREVFLALIQLGFRGRYAGRDERLAEHRERLVEGTGHGPGRAGRFTPDAYERIHECEPPEIAPVRTARLLIAGIAVLSAIVIGQYVLTTGALEQVTEAARAPR